MSGIHKPTDAELRLAALRITDPYTQEGLVQAIPPDAELADLLNTYRYERWPHEKAWCGKCGAHRHRDGFTGVLSDGSKVLLGSKCGGEIFGQSWAQASNRLSSKQNRVAILERLDELVPKIPAIIAALHGWTRPCVAMRDARRQLEKAMPDLYAGLTEAVRRNGGKLVVHEKVRNVIGQATATATQQVSEFKWVNIDFHIVQGRTFFAKPDPVGAVEQAIQHLEKARAMYADTDSVETADMAAIDRAVRDSFEQLRAVDIMHRDSKLFYTQGNLIKVAEWATRTNPVHGTYRVNGRQLICDGDNKVAALPNDYPELDPRPLQLLRRQVLQAAE